MKRKRDHVRGPKRRAPVHVPTADRVGATSTLLPSSSKLAQLRSELVVHSSPRTLPFTILSFAPFPFRVLLLLFDCLPSLSLRVHVHVSAAHRLRHLTTCPAVEGSRRRVRERGARLASRRHTQHRPLCLRFATQIRLVSPPSCARDPRV